MSPPLTYSVADWCRLVGISRSLMYALARKELGPHSVRVGTRRLITEGPNEFLARCPEIAKRGSSDDAPRREAIPAQRQAADVRGGDADPLLEWPALALQAWCGLPQAAGIVILTVGRRSAREASVLSVVHPVRQRGVGHHEEK